MRADDLEAVSHGIRFCIIHLLCGTESSTSFAEPTSYPFNNPSGAGTARFARFVVFLGSVRIKKHIS